MNTTQQKPVRAPNDKEIVSIVESLLGDALIDPASVVVGEDGCLAYEYLGDTNVAWDTQTTMEPRGHRVFKDTTGRVWNERLILNCPGSDDDTCTIPAYVSARELATVLAALRYWQRNGDCGHAVDTEPEQVVATDSGAFRALGDEEIDALCERINYL